MALYRILIFSFILLFAAPLGYAESIFVGPPVEKVKPAEKKRKRKFRKKQHFQKYKQKKENVSPVLMTILTIFSFILFIGGAVLFGFGSGIIPMWTIGLSLMVLANIFPWILVLTNKNEDETIAKSLKTLFPVFLILNFLAGLIFLVYGLAISFLLFWIIGIIFLVIAVLIFLFWFLLSKD